MPKHTVKQLNSSNIQECKVITRNPLNAKSAPLKTSAFKAALVLSTSLLLCACGGSSSESAAPVAPVTVTPTPVTPVNNATLLTVEAEDYQRFSDNTPGNEGNAFRNDDVDIEALMDESGYTVGWTESS